MYEERKKEKFRNLVTHNLQPREVDGATSQGKQFNVMK